MNWCKPHWNQLRDAVNRKGLGSFGAQSGIQAAQELEAQLRGDEEAFDPLFGSWGRINCYMAESLTKQGRGNELLALRCPLCILVEDGQPHLVANWIEGVTDDARKYAIEKKLILEQ